MSTVTTDQHSFVSITVMPVDARLGPDGAVEYVEAPLPDQDVSPEQVCQVCWQPLDQFSVKAPCPGPKVPNDISSILGS